MIPGISKLIFILFVGIATVTTALAEDFPRLDVAIPRGGNTEKYAPVFDFDGNGCLPSAGFGRDGLKNPGLRPTGSITGQCRSNNFLDTSNTLHRYACVNSGGSNYCGHFYSLYFEKDQCYGPIVDPDPLCGHRHDWEYAAVWTTDGAMTHGSVSAHGDLETRPVSEAPFEGDHLKVVYHQGGIWTHSLRFAKDDEAAENPYGSFVTPVLISWYELTGDVLSNKEMRVLIDGFCYYCDEDGGGTIPMNNDKFQKNLNKFRPSGYPDFTQESIDASNSNKPVLALFVVGDGTLRGEDTEYVLDFGKIRGGGLIAGLAVGNDALAPADSLDGDFDTTEAAPYLVMGFEPFTGLAPGDQLEGLVVTISRRGQGRGFVTGEVEFQPKGLVDTGSREPLDPITLTMSVEVLPKDHSGDSDNIFGCTMSQNRTRGVSDPTLIFMTMIAFLYIGMWRRNTRKSV